MTPSPYGTFPKYHPFWYRHPSLKQWFLFQFVHWHGFLRLPQVRLRHSFHHHPEHGLGQYLDLLLSGILNKISNRCLEHLEVLSSLFKRWCHRVLRWQRQPWPCSASPSSSPTLCRLDLWWHDMMGFNFLSTQSISLLAWHEGTKTFFPPSSTLSWTSWAPMSSDQTCPQKGFVTCQL